MLLCPDPPHVPSANGMVPKLEMPLFGRPTEPKGLNIKKFNSFARQKCCFGADRLECHKTNIRGVPYEVGIHVTLWFETPAVDGNVSHCKEAKYFCSTERGHRVYKI